MLQVRADVRFVDIPKVTLGQQVLISNPALPKPISGKVLFVSSEANIQKNTLEVKVAIDAPAEVLKPEMLVGVTYLAPEAAETMAEVSPETRLYVPQRLILNGETGSYLWVADQSAGVARKTPVTVGGVGAAGLIEVISGLNPASRVIARGHETLIDGARISIVDEEAPFVASNNSAAAAPEPIHRLPHEGE
jgi:multidrug efflux pump subunit AcrA (membrane-fusion protein)